MAPEPERKAGGRGEGEWVIGGTTVQPCLWRRRSASLRRIAWISDALREEKAEVEDAIAGKQMTESRSRKRGKSRRGKGLWCLYLRRVFCTNAEAQSASWAVTWGDQALEPLWRQAGGHGRASMRARGSYLCAACSVRMRLHVQASTEHACKSTSTEHVCKCAQACAVHSALHACICMQAACAFVH